MTHRKFWQTSDWAAWVGSGHAPDAATSPTGTVEFWVGADMGIPGYAVVGIVERAGA